MRLRIIDELLDDLADTAAVFAVARFLKSIDVSDDSPVLRIDNPNPGVQHFIPGNWHGDLQPLRIFAARASPNSMNDPSGPTLAIAASLCTVS